MCLLLPPPFCHTSIWFCSSSFVTRVSNLVSSPSSPVDYLFISPPRAVLFCDRSLMSPIPGGASVFHLSAFISSSGIVLTFIFCSAPELTSSCPQVQWDLLFPDTPIVSVFISVVSLSPIGASSVVLPLIVCPLSCHTCLNPGFCCLTYDHLDIVPWYLPSQLKWKSSPLFSDHCRLLRCDFNSAFSCFRL